MLTVVETFWEEGGEGCDRAVGGRVGVDSQERCC